MKIQLLTAVMQAASPLFFPAIEIPLTPNTVFFYFIFNAQLYDIESYPD